VSSSSRRFLSVITAMLVLFMSQQAAIAGDHVVPIRELQQRLQTTAEQRVRNIADIVRVLSYPAATAELAKHNINAAQVHQAVATLSEAELARLAKQARDVEKDVQGGLIVGLLALIGLVVVILIVVSIVSEAMPPSPGNGGIKGWATVPQVAPING
jgi:hypothetical protein